MANLDKTSIKDEVVRLKTDFDRLGKEGLTRDEKELPVIPPRPSGKLAKSDTHSLWERLKKHEDAVLLLANDLHVSFTHGRIVMQIYKEFCIDISRFAVARILRKNYKRLPDNNRPS